MQNVADYVPRSAEVFEPWKSLIDARLEDLAKPISSSALLTEAWHHAALAPGKRIRGLLLLSVLSDLGRPPLDGIDCACALELVHTASLVLDDLPCMDDAALRRGRMTLHRKVGESAAILAAVVMLNEGFALAASGGNAQIVSIMAKAIGAEGLVGGQIMDLTIQRRDACAIAETYARKTGALFQAACGIGAIMANADERCTNALQSFAKAVGLAFQITDDTLDDAIDAGRTGKDVGIDRPGSTLASVAGRSDARRWRDMALRSGRSNLTRLPRSESTRSWIDALFDVFAEVEKTSEDRPTGGFTGEHSSTD